MADMGPDFLNSQRPHPLNLGTSFRRKSKLGFHTLRYDFRPASVDKNKEGCIEVGDGNEVSVTLPHVEGSKTSCTVYKGSKKPVQKECVLIYDHETKEFTLERISSQLQVKKTRNAGSIPSHAFPVLAPAPKIPKIGGPKKTVKPNRPPVKKPENKPMTPPTFNKPSETTSPDEPDFSTTLPTIVKPAAEAKSAFSTDDESGSTSSSSSDSSSDNSSSSSDEEDPKSPPLPEVLPVASNLQDDLLLSDSGSDSE